MKEAYVTFDTAKLLEKKGFDCASSYSTLIRKEGKDFMLCPSQSVVCRWLREQHKILVTVQPCEVGTGVDDYTYVIYEIQPEDYHFKFIGQGRMQPVTDTMDCEGTLEEGIKYALTNLI